MAQIIKHRRGSLESLSAVTSSLQKGEIVIASGSSNLTVTNGASVVFAVAETGQVQAINRFLMGTSAPNTFAAGTYNGLLKGVPYYASGSSTLYLLGEGSNDIPNLVGNIQVFSTSVDSRLDAVEASLGGGGEVGTRVAALEATSASVNIFTASISTSVGLLQTTASYLNGTFSTSIDSRLDVIEGTFSTSVDARLDVVEATASLYTTFSTSVDTRLDTIEAANARQATTGSNLFIGDQVITGSVYINANLIVQGSSSLQNITASAANIGTNTIILNTATPAIRYGGISVQDSGSTNGRSGSLFWDSFNDYWIYVTPTASTEGYNSAILISGPKNSGSLGSEAGLTTGYIQVAVGEDHIGNSIMSQSAGLITLTGDFKASGEISSSTINGIGNVTTYSSSVNSRVVSLETSIGGGGSLGTRVTNLETISASYLTFTSSYYTTSQSFDSRLDTVELVSASAAAALNTFSASNATTDNTQTTNITTTTQAAAGAFASASAYSASAATVYYTSANATTLSTSVNSRLIVVEAVSASAASALNSFSASNATTDNTQTTNISAASASAAGAFASASLYSSSFATTISNLGTTYATDAELTSLSTSVATRNAGQDTSISAASASAAGAFTSASAYSASAATVDGAQDVLISSLRTNILSASVFTTFSTSADSRLDVLEAFSQSFDTAFDVSGTNVTIAGNLTVSGTTTTINSTTVQIGDNIIELNGTGVANGGLYVKDPTSPTTGTGSIVWDSTNDYWKAGLKDSEYRILTVNDGVVSGSSQITISSTTGYSTFSSSLATSISSSNATSTQYSASFATTIGNLGSTYATDAELSSVSGAFYTTVSASSATTTALSSSLNTRVKTLEGTGTIQGVGTTNTVTFAAVTASLNVPSGGGNSKRIAFRGTTDNIEFVTAPTTAGDLVQWDGTNFTMSNVIDGGTY